MKLFLTGASGFIGGAIARTLAQQTGKYELVAMSRSETSDRAIQNYGARPVRSELGAVSREQLAGVDAIIHNAAYVHPWGRRADFQRVTVEGTRQLLAVAREAGVRRFVHMGTDAVTFAGQDQINVDESQAYPRKHRYNYSEAKAQAEQLVLSASDPGDFDTISLRPRIVWGPGDTTVLPVLLDMIERGGFMWINDGRAKTDTLHIANLVHATELALTKGVSGHAYYITDDETTTFREFMTALVATRGVTLPERSAPGRVTRALAYLIESAWLMLRLKGDPPLTRFAAGLMSSEGTLRIDRAKNELGYKPLISIAQGMRELADAP
ncbi:MAG: NAD-dependent epimerase/dehydratase family protein [Leptospirales bacterium]|jgi:nucleoside-diphosphate-sugar epimerase